MAAGAIYPVNPKVTQIGDLRCYPDIGSLRTEVPDVGIVLLGAERAHLAVRELAQRGTRARPLCWRAAIPRPAPRARAGRAEIDRGSRVACAAALGPTTIGLLVNLERIAFRWPPAGAALAGAGAFPGGRHRRGVAERRHSWRAALGARRHGDRPGPSWSLRATRPIWTLPISSTIRPTMTPRG